MAETGTSNHGGAAAIGGVAALVAAVALVMRLPSCGESFWLDELHSAWAVGGSFSEVAPRAAMGNQTSGYFHLLWVWSSLVGQGELPMRLSSVLATCLASALLVVGVALRTGNPWAGLVAGALLAVDPNGVFFGCELRPYAFVMLYSVLAVWSMMAWLGPTYFGPLEMRRDAVGGRFWKSHYGARWRLAMLFWICVAALIHPTSLGVLSLLIPSSVAVAWMRGRLQLWRADAVAAIVVAATLCALAASTLPESWERRDLWKAFGRATSWWQLWYAWSWIPIVVVPIVAVVLVGAVGRIMDRFPKTARDDSSSRPTNSTWIGIVPGAVAVVATIVYFCLSYFDWVPLWHRRYFVAALPLLAWTMGELVAICVAGLVRIINAVRGDQEVREKRRIDWFCGLMVGVSLIGFTLWYQGTLQTLAGGRLPLQLRGEQWRGAVDLVRDQMQKRDVVWLDSQLIEASFLRRPPDDSDVVSEAQWDYLSFPLGGPYRLDPVTVVDCHEHESWIRRHLATLPSGPATVWLVSRSGSQSATRFVERLKRFRSMTSTKAFSGRPIVLRLDFGE